MVELAANLTDHVLPPLPLRQWVFSLPKRIRPFLPHDAPLAGAVLRILLRAIRTTPPPLSPARGPPQHELDFHVDGEHLLALDQTPDFDPTEPQPVPDHDFDPA